MRAALLAVAVAVMAHAASALQSDLSALDPQDEADRGELLRLVTRSSNGASNRAARILAEAGHIEMLLEVLESTTSYNTMQAIAQTRSELTIPIFKSRLEANPESRHLVGALAYVQNPKAGPILAALLERHADGDKPHDYDMVGCLLNAMVFNRCRACIPLLRERLRACNPALPERRAYYAIVLCSLGAPEGPQCLVELMREGIAAGRDVNSAFRRFSHLCNLMRNRSVKVACNEDRSLFEDLLPILVDGSSSKDRRISGASVAGMRLLTRHDFGPDSGKWQQWHKAHANSHPVYTTPLDRAAKACVERFRANLSKAAEENAGVKAIVAFLPKTPRNGYGAHNPFLWRLESRPEQDSRPIPPHDRTERRALKVVLEISQRSRGSQLDHVTAREEFASVNITARLALWTDDDDVREVVVECFRNACKPISTYAERHRERDDAEPPRASGAASEGADDAKARE